MKWVGNSLTTHLFLHSLQFVHNLSFMPEYVVLCWSS